MKYYTVKSGDTLDQLLIHFYGYSNDELDIAVAKYNKLNKFRHLTSGMQLIFPPITTLNLKRS